MSVKVRRGGALFLAIAAGTTLVQTSTLGSAAFAAGGHTLNLRVPTSGGNDGPNGSTAPNTPTVGTAWAVAGGGFQSLRAAHALTGEAGTGRDGVAGGGQVIVVSLTVGI